LPVPPSTDAHPFDALVAVMDTLRGPDGCPWDHAQTLQTLKPYALEEVHEVLEAIDGGVPEQHCDELGDLLLQVVFQSRIRKEEGHFDAYDVCRAIIDKMVRRHPHVYGDASEDDAVSAKRSWDAIKAGERKDRGRTGPGALLAGVPRSLPALLRAQRLGSKASTVGFDWGDAEAVLPKCHEEVDELLAAEDPQAREHELGDLLFALVNLARHLRIDAEHALQSSSDRFTARFEQVERLAQAGGAPISARTPDDLEALWQQAKRQLEA
jgi:tetrapyrrole methylase family protein/MazG family protein